MRYLILSFILLCIGVTFTVKPVGVTRVIDRLAEGRRRFMNDKQIEFEGLNYVSEAELLARLPQEKSLWWWLFNPSQVEAALSGDSLIAAVNVAPCVPTLVQRWGCFRVSVKERNPAFIAMIEGRYWLVGNDGGFLAPLPVEKNVLELASNLSARTGEPMRVLHGLDAVRNSPDLVLARFSYAKRVMDTIESTSGLHIEWGELLKSGHLVAKFQGIAPRATFSFSDADDDLRVVEVEARRLKTLVDRLGDGMERLETVDLTPRKLVVGKPKLVADEAQPVSE
jgi:cell division septal protein FtsQ